LNPASSPRGDSGPFRDRIRPPNDRAFFRDQYQAGMIAGVVEELGDICHPERLSGILDAPSISLPDIGFRYEVATPRRAAPDSGDAALGIV